MTRPFDKHLDSDELDSLVSLLGTSASASEQLSEPTLGEAQRHVESCQACSRKLQRHKFVHSEILRMRVPNPSPPTPECMGDDEWLDVVAGLLPEVRTRELMKHAAQCGHCGPLLKNAAETIADEASPSEEALLASLQSARPEWRKNMAATLRDTVRDPQPKPSWLRAVFAWPAPTYAFAGIVAVALVAWIGVGVLHPPSAEQLLAEAYSEHRTLEVRIPGAQYAPMQAERGTGQSDFDKPHSLLKAKDLIGEALNKNPNDPKWLQARARAELLDGNYESAIKSLQRAMETQPNSPGLLTDLGSAYFVRAESANRAIDYGNAIESLGKALAKSPDDPIALFNRALACEHMFLYSQAMDDWEHYLRVDPQGEWSDDARRRLSALKEKIEQHDKSSNESLLTPSQITQTSLSDATMPEKIDRRIEEYLSLAMVTWLPDSYPNAQASTSSAADSRRALGVLSEIAVEKHEDHWLADLLTYSASANFAPAIAQLSDALRANDAGDNVAAREHASAAERLFAQAGDEAGALRAHIEYLFASHDAQEAKPCLDAARGTESRFTNRSYPWLAAQFHIEEGTCYGLLENLGQTRRLYERAAHEAQASGYNSIYLRTQDHLSTLDVRSGFLLSGWVRTQRALATFWRGQYAPMRGYNLYYNLYEFSRVCRQPYLQIAAWRDGILLSESFRDNVISGMAHSLMADAAIGAGQPQTAESEFTRARQLFAAAPQIKSTRIAGLEAETRLGEVEASEGKPQESVLRLRQLAREISKLSDNLLAIMFYTTLGDAESGIGQNKEAESALLSAIALAELQLKSIGDEVSRLRWSQQTSRTYRNFVQLRFHQGNTQEALEIWESYRGAPKRSGRVVRLAGMTTVPASFEPHEVASQLHDITKETVISYALLPYGMATWVYDNRGIFAHWTEGSPKGIAAVARRFRSLCSDPASDEADLRQNARGLYDLLVAPVEQYLSPDRILVVELDEGLEGLPFEALLDAGNHYLADRGPVISSLGIYYRLNSRDAAITPKSRALVAAVPVSSVTDDPPALPLPDAASEGEMVADAFDGTRFLTGNAATVPAVLSQLAGVSVFHFAGHAISSPQHSGLLLFDGLLSADSLKQDSLSAMQLAVFSACDTQDGSDGGVYDADSLAGFFLRAGVPHIVASRWKVDSAATRQFMNLFYRALLDGSSVSDSIHQAQVALRSRSGMAHPYYWSAFTAFGTV
ncbi:MAG TPA: CHAT domain-containing tetratricopeptide repeat protein [Candidatus Sulfotelmatobacter sp.]